MRNVRTRDGDLRADGADHAGAQVPAETARQRAENLLLGIALVAAVTFIASWLGIITRPRNQLAAFWPTNALLLGILIRNPGLGRRPSVWLAACLGYVLADMVVGDDFVRTIRLTSANLVGVGVGWALFWPLLHTDRVFSHPAAMLRILLLSGVASIAAAVVGGLSAQAILGTDWLRGFGFWFSAELVSYAILLPAILLAPTLRALPQQAAKRMATIRARPSSFLPLVALAASAMLAIAMDGPGAIMLSVPALLWCALTYEVFTTALLTMCWSIWTLVAIANGTMVLSPAPLTLQETISLRIGVAMLAPVPLTIAGISATRNRLLAELKHAADHDSLTDVLSRGAFIRRTRSRLADLASRRSPATLLLLDVDFFKGVNDRHGHAAGDQVLVMLAGRMRSAMGPDDVLARFGGEEFAVFLPGAPAQDGALVAERLREIVGREPIVLADGGQIGVTASIGWFSIPAVRQDVLLKDMLRHADRALYQAKAAGRNRAVQALD